jgi:peptidoglycan/xylan/chitin deacetylase (PgdA/CDA1 family)
MNLNDAPHPRGPLSELRVVSNHQRVIVWRFLKSLAGAISPAGPRARLSILIYHRVLAQPDPLLPTEPDASTFAWQMEMLAEYFHVLSLSEAVEHLQNGTLPARAASITFDDGYADNIKVALPILQQRGVPATFFIASGYLDGGRMWNDTIIEAVRLASGGILDLNWLTLGHLPIATLEQRYRAILTLLSKLKYTSKEERQRKVAAIADMVGAELPDDLMMRAEDVRALAASGMEVGAHTVSHPILNSISDEQGHYEIESSRQRLAEITGRPVHLFAYPNGKPGSDYDLRHVQIVRELGFRGAVSTAWGVATRSTNVLQLPRFTPWDRTPTRFLARLLQNYWRGSRRIGGLREMRTTARASSVSR